MRLGLKLFGMTTTPLCMLNLRATWAEVLLYFLATDTSSSSFNNGGHFRFTLFKRQVFSMTLKKSLFLNEHCLYKCKVYYYISE